MRSRYIFYVQIVYLLACALWITLLALLGVFHRPASLSHLILGVPLIVYAFGYTNVATHERVEPEMFRSDFVAVALVFVILFVRWIDKRPTSMYILRITLAAFTLIVLSMLDVWVSYRAVIVEKHVKSALHTAGITMLLYVLFVYFTDALLIPPTSQTQSTDSDAAMAGLAAL